MRIMPISTETTIPIKTGCCSVPQFTMEPNPAMNCEIGGPSTSPTAEPETIETIGVIRISSFVFPETSLPSSMPTKAAINAPSGSPGPENCITPSTSTVPARILPENAPTIPQTAAEMVTSGAARYLCATPTPIPAPVSAAATLLTITRYPPNVPPTKFPICSKIVPIISVENSPAAIPLRPSIKT